MTKKKQEDRRCEQCGTGYDETPQFHNYHQGDHIAYLCNRCYLWCDRNPLVEFYGIMDNALNLAVPPQSCTNDDIDNIDGDNDYDERDYNDMEIRDLGDNENIDDITSVTYTVNGQGDYYSEEEEEGEPLPDEEEEGIFDEDESTISHSFISEICDDVEYEEDEEFLVADSDEDQSEIEIINEVENEKNNEKDDLMKIRQEEAIKMYKHLMERMDETLIINTKSSTNNVSGQNIIVKVFDRSIEDDVRNLPMSLRRSSRRQAALKTMTRMRQDVY